MNAHSLAGPHCDPGHDGEPGPSGDPGYMAAPPNVGIPSPHSVTQIQVTQLRWEYLIGCQIMERIEIWHEGQRLAASARSIGVTGGCGPA